MGALDSQIIANRARAEAAARNAQAGFQVNPVYISLVDDTNPIDFVTDSGAPYGSKPLSAGGIQRLWWDEDNPGLGWQDYGEIISTKAYADALDAIRAAADTTLQSNINTEAASRVSADATLQGLIDDLEASQNTGSIAFEDKAAMDADLAHDAGVLASVNNDATASNNGYYRKTGASGGGSWVKRDEFYVTVLDPVDTSEAVTGKAVGDTLKPRKTQVYPTYDGETSGYFGAYIEEDPGFGNSVYVKFSNIYARIVGSKTFTWADFKTEINDGTLFTTSTKGITDCLTLSEKALVYDTDDSLFKVVAREDVVMQSQVVIVSSANGVVVEPSRWMNYVRLNEVEPTNSKTPITGAAVKEYAGNSSYFQFYADTVDVSGGEGFYFEENYEVSTGVLAFKFANIFARLGSAKSLTWAQFKTEINDAGLFGTSPKGVSDCLLLELQTLVYDKSDNTFKVVNRTDLVKNTQVPLISSSNGIIVHPSALYGEFLRNELLDYPKNNSNVIYLDPDTDGLVLEETRTITGNLYLKSSASGFGDDIFAKGYLSSAGWTWAEFKAVVLLTESASRFDTSPNGVDECLVLNHNDALVYDFTETTDLFKIVTLADLSVNHYVIASNVSGRIGPGTRDISLIRLSAKNKVDESGQSMISQVAPIAAQKMMGIVSASTALATRFSIVQIGDIHYNSLNADLNLKEVFNLVDHPIIDGKIKAVVCVGDVNNGAASRTKATTVAENTSFRTRALTSPVPFINTIGNHCDNINYGGGGLDGATAFANAITKAEQYAQLIQPFADEWTDIIDVTDKCYTYTDFATEKIRIICLDFVSQPTNDDGSGGIKYTGGYYYSQDQLDWLQTTLVNTPADYGVILVNHGAAVEGYDIGTYIQGKSLIYDIINAFKNGTTFVHSYTDAVHSGDLSTSKTFDFTTANTNEFICHLSGHCHTLEFIRPEDYTDQWIIITPNLWTGSTIAYYTDGFNPIVRDDSNENRNSFNIISVDRELSKIFITTFGAYADVNGINLSRSKVLSY